jgi:ADP-heptose:LPS heptosyltransferase
MSLLAIKKFVISFRIGIFLDAILRFCLSALPLLHSIIARQKIAFKPKGFAFFLYGGIGDAIMILNLVNAVARHSKVYIFSDKKIINLRFLFPENAEILVYDKSEFKRDIPKFRSKLGTDIVFVQTSPVIEIYLIRQVLGIKYAVGMLANYSALRCQGLRGKAERITDVSKQLIYGRIYLYLCQIFSWPSIGEHNNSNKEIIPADLDGSKYLVMSVTKTSYWGMGKMDNTEYLKIAEHYVTEHGFKIVFVGDYTERDGIERMISASRFSQQMINSAGTTSLKQLSDLLQGAKFVISNDNGIAHLASYVRVKILVLFMFSDPEVYRWSGEFYQFLFNKKKKCMPCVGVNIYPKDNYPVICRNSLACNFSIRAGDVISEIDRLGWAL